MKISKQLSLLAYKFIIYSIAYWLVFSVFTVAVSTIINDFSFDAGIEAAAFGIVFLGPLYFIIITSLSLIGLCFTKKKLLRNTPFFLKLGVLTGLIPIGLSLLFIILE